MRVISNVTEKRVQYGACSKWLVQLDASIRRKRGWIVRLRCRLDSVLEDWDQWPVYLNKVESISFLSVYQARVFQDYFCKLLRL